MARVTVEDCVSLIPNRFELVMVAAQRARDIHSGAPLQVDRDRDKNPVVALREIADEKLDIEGMKDTLVRGHQQQVEADLPEDDIIELMAGEQGWINTGAAGEDSDMSEGFGEVDEDEDLSAEDEEAEADLGADEEL